MIIASLFVFRMHGMQFQRVCMLSPTVYKSCSGQSRCAAPRKASQATSQMKIVDNYFYYLVNRFHKLFLRCLLMQVREMHTTIYMIRLQIENQERNRKTYKTFPFISFVLNIICGVISGRE